jgi:hypothetical protein
MTSGSPVSAIDSATSPIQMPITSCMTMSLGGGGVGAHNAGKRVRAPGRHRWINRTLEALVVVGIIAIAAYAGWVSFIPASAPPGSILNAPVQTVAPSRPAERPVPPVDAALLSETTPPTPQKKAPMTKPTRTRHGDS